MSAVCRAFFCAGLLLSLCSSRDVLADAPANDRFPDAVVIGSSLDTNVVLSGSNIDATMDPGESFHAESPSGRSVWWTWTPLVNASVVISTEGSTFDTLLAVYTGSAVTSLVSVVSSDDDVGTNGR